MLDVWDVTPSCRNYEFLLKPAKSYIAVMKNAAYRFEWTTIVRSPSITRKNSLNIQFADIAAQKNEVTSDINVLYSLKSNICSFACLRYQKGGSMYASSEIEMIWLTKRASELNRVASIIARTKSCRGQT